MNNLRFLSCLLPLIILGPLAAGAQVNIFGVDSWPELVAAIDQANQEGGGRIRLQAFSTLLVEEPLPGVTTKLAIDGNGATLLGDDANPVDVLLTIEAGGMLEIQSIHFHRILGAVSLISNSGDLWMNDVSVSASPALDFTSKGGVLDNYGSAYLDNVTIVNNEGRGISDIGVSIRNILDGPLEIRNSTIARNVATVTGGSAQQPLGPKPAAITGVVSIGSTILDNEGGNCLQLGHEPVALIDLGGNLDSDDSCGLDPQRNVVGKSAALASFGMHGGLVPTLALDPVSPAIDRGVDEFCSAVDARLASRLGRCDIGAYEFSGGFGNADLDANGINGLWFNRASDGHYVHVMRVAADRAYINWSTFDRQGRQAWVFAVVAQDEDGVYSGDAHINVGGTLIPGGAPVGQAPVLWGTLSIEFSDCANGEFRYESTDPDFGAGEFALERLAFIDGVGCSEGS